MVTPTNPNSALNSQGAGKPSKADGLMNQDLTAKSTSLSSKWSQQIRMNVAWQKFSAELFPAEYKSGEGEPPPFLERQLDTLKDEKASTAAKALAGLSFVTIGLASCWLAAAGCIVGGVAGGVLGGHIGAGAETGATIALMVVGTFLGVWSMCCNKATSHEITQASLNVPRRDLHSKALLEEDLDDTFQFKGTEEEWNTISQSLKDLKSLIVQQLDLSKTDDSNHPKWLKDFSKINGVDFNGEFSVLS